MKSSIREELQIRHKSCTQYSRKAFHFEHSVEKWKPDFYHQIMQMLVLIIQTELRDSIPNILNCNKVHMSI